MLWLYKRDSVGPPTKTSWWGKAGHKLALSTRKLCSDIQKTEFEIICERADFGNKRFTASLRQFFFENNVQNKFSETFKLSMTTAEVERCFSTLKKYHDRGKVEWHWCWFPLNKVSIYLLRRK